MKTDWDQYYLRPYKTAAYSRRIMTGALIRLMKRHADPGSDTCIVEVGGGNSCFFSAIRRNVPLGRYHVIDENRCSLELLKESVPSDPALVFHEENALTLELTLEADLVFSVGLIEHFSEPETARIIATHFRLARPGGIVIIGFPTPTLLYRLTRSLSEAMGKWIFHDERPLTKEEVLPTILHSGQVLDRRTIWPMFLTQMVITARKA